MVILREAEFEDYTAIAKLHAGSWKKNYRSIWSDDFLDNKVDEDRLSVWFQRMKSPGENQHTTVTLLNNTIVGFCCAFLDDDPVFGTLIDNLHVSTDLQRSGIGRGLLTDCAQWINEKSENKKMHLWVYDANTNAKTFYARLGGELVEKIEKINEDGTSAICCRFTWNDLSKFLTP